MKPMVVSFSLSHHNSATFVQYIRKARLEKGLKQVDLAEEIGVNEMTIVNWEHYPNISIRYGRKVVMLCKVLNIDRLELERKFPYG